MDIQVLERWCGFWEMCFPETGMEGKKKKSKTKLLVKQGLATKRQEMAEDLQAQPKLSQPGSRLLLSSAVNSTARAIMLSCHPF